MPVYTLTACQYRRPFDRPLTAAWGKWTLREGILVRLRGPDGPYGYGEVAPLPAFGSESMESATDFIGKLPDELDQDTLLNTIREAPPATAFGLWSAWKDASHSNGSTPPVRTAALLGLPELNEATLMQYRPQGYRTYKVKLGVSSPEEELEAIGKALPLLEDEERLRLDPNRSWDMDTLSRWMEYLSPFASLIDFIEEPLERDSCDPESLTTIARKAPIPLALDESLSENGWKFWLEKDWPGWWILKPSIMGQPDWRDGLSAQRDRIVLSSVFETAIGMGPLVQMANSYPNNDHGLGTADFFSDGFTSSEGTWVYPPSRIQLEHIWQELSSS